MMDVTTMNETIYKLIKGSRN